MKQISQPDASGIRMTLLLDFLKKYTIVIYNPLMHDPKGKDF